MRRHRRLKKFLLCLLAAAVLVAAFFFFFPQKAKPVTDWMRVTFAAFFDTEGIFGPKREEGSLQVSATVPDGFSWEEMPEWNGQDAYVMVNGGIPFFTPEERNSYTAAVEEYSVLDRLGRCGTAFAVIDRSMMPEEERAERLSVYPSGWNQKEYPGLIDAESDFLYNRCHLIAYCLTAENDNEKNLITGTRYMNVEGMENGMELEVLDYLYENPERKVFYRVTPVFLGRELVCRGVLMEALSDDGSLSRCIYCYNVQPGIHIDYTDGTSRKE